MQVYLLVLKIFAAFVLGAAAGLFIYGLAVRVTKKKDARAPRLLAVLCFAVVCALLAWRFDSPFQMFFSFAIFAFLLFHSLTDIENGHIYDLPVVMMAAAGLLFRLWGGVPAVVDGVLGAAVGWGLIYAVRVVSRGGMGTGDATLMLGAGALLGWQLTLLALYCGIIAGGVFVVTMLFMKKMRMHDTIPLAPFLASGSLLSILAGEPVFTVLRSSLAWPWIV